MFGRRDIGQLELLLLAVIAREPLYGYAIIGRLRELSAGVLDLPEGNVYPALHKLEKRHAITSHWTLAKGRRRKVYTLTESGAQLLEEQRRTWEAVSNAVRRALAW